MPSTVIKPIVFTLIVLTANAESANSEKPQWRRGYNNQWCIQMASKEACLPVGAELTRFEKHYAWWHKWEELGHVIQIKYDAEAPAYDDSMLSSQCLVLRSSFGNRSVLVTELATESEEEQSNTIGIFVVVFDDKFAITLSGTNPARMRDIASSLVEQWSSISQ